MGQFCFLFRGRLGYVIVGVVMSQNGHKANRAAASALRLTAIYALVAGLWVLLSSSLLPLLLPWLTTAQLGKLETYKGWFFVAATATMLYVLIRRRLTALLESQTALEETETKFQALVEESLVGVYIILGTDFAYVNPRFAALFGYRPEELIGGPVLRMVAEESHALVSENMRARLEGRVLSMHYTLTGRRKDGTRLDVEVLGSRTIYHGRPAIIGSLLDVTDRKRAERELRESEARYRLLFDSNPHPMMVFDSETLRYVAVNEATLRHYGYSREEFLAMTIKDIRPAEDIPALMESVSRRVEGLDRAGVWRHRKKDGTLIDVEIIGHRMTLAGRRVELVLANDVTERKRVEEALRDSEQRYRLIFETAANLINSVDANGILVDCNSRISTVLGYGREEVVGNSVAKFIHPEDLPRVMGVLREIIDQGQSTGNEWRMIRKDGQVIDVRVNSTSIRDPEGRFVRTICILDDITERKRLERQLLQSQKMEAIGRLAGGVAHDFNNLLAVISGYSESLERRLSEESPLRVHVEEIAKAAERGASLTKQLLAFSRRQAIRPQVLDLNEIVRNMEEMLRRVLGRKITVSVELEEELGRIKADRGQIEQVILNLAINARDAMNGEGRLKICTGQVEVDQEAAAVYGVSPGRYVILLVSDTGCGMDGELQAKIFEPFFTTKEGKGTGLGLSIVYGIVQQAGGSVHVRSKPGEGSVFEVLLPWVEEAAEVEAEVVG